MIDETNLNQEKQMLFDAQAKSLKKKFEKRRINFYSCENKLFALNTIKSILYDFIENNGAKTIAFSDSATLHQLDVYEMVNKLSIEFPFEIINPFKRFSDGKLEVFGKQPEGKLDIPNDE